MDTAIGDLATFGPIGGEPQARQRQPSVRSLGLLALGGLEIFEGDAHLLWFDGSVPNHRFRPFRPAVP
jgi:hypothetical protein